MTQSMSTLFENSKAVLPVIVINDLDTAVPLAEALVSGGVTLLEVTLRTEQGLEAISLMKNIPNAIVGAGTVTTPEQMEQAVEAGAQFIVSPGISRDLCETAKRLNVPFAPGVMTPSDIMLGMEFGIELFKFFPAAQAGGIPMLKAFAGPFPNVQFCPTGGITPSTSGDYLALPNVVAVGGSWLSPNDLIQNHDWAAIQTLAENA